jgi:hypothetical protein
MATVVAAGDLGVQSEALTNGRETGRAALWAWVRSHHIHTAKRRKSARKRERLFMRIFFFNEV